MFSNFINTELVVKLASHLDILQNKLLDLEMKECEHQFVSNASLANKVIETDNLDAVHVLEVAKSTVRELFEIKTT